MALCKVWIHVVWATKKRERIILPEACQTICQHIRQNAFAKGFHIAELNGHLDHFHCLMLLKSDWSVAKQMQMIKGEASNWINKNKILPVKLEWGDEYFASSVSEGKLDVVRNYIRNQDVHHRKTSFE
jgi:putative transposase